MFVAAILQKCKYCITNISNKHLIVIAPRREGGEGVYLEVSYYGGSKSNTYSSSKK